MFNFTRVVVAIVATFFNQCLWIHLMSYILKVVGGEGAILRVKVDVDTRSGWSRGYSSDVGVTTYRSEAGVGVRF